MQITTASAIEAVKKNIGALEDYPNDEGAGDWRTMHQVSTEQASEGMYVAFVTEGSGVPYISAQCYLVDDQMRVTPSGEYDNSKTPMYKVNSFSAKLCKPIEIDLHPQQGSAQ